MKSLNNLGIHYQSSEDQELMKSFFGSFDYGDGSYDITQILTAIYLMSNSDKNEKALALFDLYDFDSSQQLEEMEFNTAIQRICESVFEYSEKLMEVEEDIKDIHRESFNEAV